MVCLCALLYVLVCLRVSVYVLCVCLLMCAHILYVTSYSNFLLTISFFDIPGIDIQRQYHGYGETRNLLHL